jgi:hypothetical protein
MGSAAARVQGLIAESNTTGPENSVRIAQALRTALPDRRACDILAKILEKAVQDGSLEMFDS